MAYTNSTLNGCGCNQALNDKAGVESLNNLYKKEGDGSLTLIEKIIHNPIAVGVGFLVGTGAGYFLLGGSKKRK